MLYTPKSELYNRINRLQSILIEKEIDGVLILQDVDLFYFSGTAQNAHLYIPSQGQPILMVRKSLRRAREESALENIVQLTSLKKLPDLLADAGHKIPKTLGLELDVLPANTYLYYKKIFDKTEIVDVSGSIRLIRQIKSGYEIDLLRNSGRKMNEVYNEIPSMIKEGMTECELAAKIEGMARAKGHVGYIHMRAFNQAPFFGHLMSGWTAAVPSSFDSPTGGLGLTPVLPQGCSLKRIKKGEPIFIDYAGLWDGYITDQTRIYSIGPLTDKLKQAFELSLEIQSAILERVEPEANGSELHKLALNLAEKAGLGDHFMGFAPDQARFVGHGIGLELDEFPILAKGLNMKFKPGIVFAIEPKFNFPEEGVVGIENTFVLTENGIEKLTITPDKLVEL